MSVNVYARTAADDPTAQGMHIGQRRIGTEFLFRAHTELGLISVAAYHEYLTQPGIEIIGEHGLVYEFGDFWRDATARPADVGGLHRMSSRWSPHQTGDDRQWRDVKGHPFADYEFC